MESYVKIKMNEKLFLRNPEESELGKRIVEHSILLIHEIGFEAFTFKKLAAKIKTTEAGVYRYFENKHRLLIYIVDWYWSWQEYRLIFQTNNISKPEIKLKLAIKLLSSHVEIDNTFEYINETLLYDIVMRDGAKSYLSSTVKEDNKNKLFQPYKDLCGHIAVIILECNKKYKYPRTLASTIIEMAHSQTYYMKYLPSLTDFANSKKDSDISNFLENIVFSAINNTGK